MSLFRRRSSGAAAAQAQAEAIAAFWSWWESEGEAQATSAVANRTPENLAEPLSTRIRAIHPDLAWELSQGSESAHLLVVTAEGVGQLRPIARRWRRSAPEPDAVWSYADTRPPIADPAGTVLELNGVRLELGQATAGARVSGSVVDVAVHHPAFAELTEQARAQAAFLLLDFVLGEAAVELWIGAIETTVQPSIDPVPLAGLRATVRDLSAQFTGADGNPQWALLQGEAADGAPVLANVQIPLRSAIAPDFDTHVAVIVPIAHPTPEGLPDGETLTALRAFEEHLTGRLGRSGQIVAHETSAGVRTLHYYVDGTTPAADQLKAAADGWAQGRVAITVADDPAWDGVGHLRV